MSKGTALKLLAAAAMFEGMSDMGMPSIDYNGPKIKRAKTLLPRKEWKRRKARLKMAKASRKANRK